MVVAQKLCEIDFFVKNSGRRTGLTVVCIGNFTPRPGRKMSAVVGWVNVKDWSIPHLKALTVTFKLM